MSAPDRTNALVPVSETPAFDYGGTDPDIVRKAGALASELRAFHRRTTEEAHRFGLRLIELRDKMETGLFVRWVEAEVGIGKSSAYRFMQLAGAFSPETVSHVGKLGPTVAYSLASSSTPELTRCKVVQRLCTGEELSGPTVAEIIRGDRHREKVAKAEAKLSEKQRKARAARKARQERDWARERAESERELWRVAKARDLACSFLVGRLGSDLDEFLRLLDDADGFVRSYDVRRAQVSGGAS